MSTEPTSMNEAQEAIREARRKRVHEAKKASLVERLTRSLTGQSEANNFSHRLADLYREGK